ncbi:MAG: PKD domain-containing protein [Anaerolineae bacterium]|nr:PKD domain-containing protein [Anaerolineae bacterium]
MLFQATKRSRFLPSLLLVLCISVFVPIASGQAAFREPSETPEWIIVDSNITEDTTWTTGNSYLLQANVDVEPGVTLTIEPGVVVGFFDKYYFDILEGASLIARGTADQHISFIRPSGTPRWIKIWFHENTTSYLRYVDVSGGGSSGSSDDCLVHFDGPGTHVINNCTFDDSQESAVVVSGNSSLNVTIAGAEFGSNIGRRSIMVDSGANLTVSGTTFNPIGDAAIYLRTRTVPAQVTVSNSNLLSTGPVVVWNDMSTATCIAGQNNWWGAANGPYDPSATGDACGLGSHGGSGATVSNGVDYTNWLAAAAPIVGITTPPNAVFTVTPDPGDWMPPGTTYTFDASASSDAEDFAYLLEVCWDWNNDGSCDTAWSTEKTAQYTFVDGGVHTVRLVVRDTDGDTGIATQDIYINTPPTAAFTTGKVSWNHVELDASPSYDAETPNTHLQARWDWMGDGEWDTSVVSVTVIQTYPYPHLGRYWPTLSVSDTVDVADTMRRKVDVVPPQSSAVITGSGGTLTSVDSLFRADVYTRTVGGDVISTGLAITLTPWVTLPHAISGGAYVYHGFNLAARSLADGQPVEEVSGTFTITLSYDEGYFADVLHLPYEERLQFYRWSEAGSVWVMVPAALEATADQLVAATSFFGDFLVSMDVNRIYLPVAVRAP